MKREKNHKGILKRIQAIALSVFMVFLAVFNNGIPNASAQSTTELQQDSTSYGTQLYTKTGEYTEEGNPVTVTIYSTKNDSIGDLAVITGTGTLKSSNVYGNLFYPYGDLSSIKKVVIGEGITGIGTLFYSYLRSITEVELSSTMSAIADSAFQNCSGLTKITIPDNIISIGYRAFSDCNNLNELVISNNSNLKTIGDYAFYGCSSLEDKDIFTNCQQLISVPGTYTFEGTNYTGEIILPKSLTTFGAFASCIGRITSLYMPDAITTIPSQPANVVLKYKIENNQTTITYINNIDKNVTSVTLLDTICGADVVAVDAQYRNNPVTINCTNHRIVDHTCQLCGLTTKCGENTYYEYADGVLSILGSGAMAGYTYESDSPWYSYRDAIEKIVIGKDVTRIGVKAFAGCTKLTDIQIEEGSVLSEIGSDAFYGSGYTGMLVLPDTLSTLEVDSFYFNGDGNVLVFLPEAAYVENSGTESMWYSVVNGEATITKISIVYMCNQTITLPETINGHKLVAVSDVVKTAIKSAEITLADTAHSWDLEGHTCRICGYASKCGDNMFYSIKDNVLTLSGSGDMYCYSNSIKTGTLPPWDSLRDSITKVVVGKDITSIGNHAFDTYNNIENLIFEEGSKLQEVKECAFLGCSKLSDVVLPETVDYIDVSFQSCSSAVIYYPENANISLNSFIAAKGFAAYKVINGKKYITSPTTDMLKVPEDLVYTGIDLKEMALTQVDLKYDDIIVQGVTFGVDIDETKWVKSILEDKVIYRGNYTAQYTGTITCYGQNETFSVKKIFAVGRAEGEGKGSVEIPCWTYGAAAGIPVPASVTNGTDNVIFYYKGKDAADDTYKVYNSTQEGMFPVNSGDYILKAVFGATDSIGEAIAFVDFTINKADITGVTIGEVTGTYTYDKTEKVPTVIVTDSEASITLSDYGYSYSNNIGAGTATITITGTGNYTGTVSRTFTIAKAPAPTIEFPSVSGFTYGQKLSESTLTDGSTQYGTFVWTNANTVPTLTNSGYQMTFTPSADTVANYENTTSKTETISFNVSKATPAVTVNTVISDDSGKRKAVLTATVKGVGYGETPTGTVKFVDRTIDDDVDLAEIPDVTIADGKTVYTWSGLADQVYKVEAVYSGSENYNTAYSSEISFDTSKQNQGVLTIGSIGTKTYGDEIFTLSVIGGSGNGTVTYDSSDPTIVSVSGTTATIHKAGNVTITATKAGNDDYNEATTSVSLTVGKKSLTVNADDKLNVLAGSAMPQLTYSIKGLVGSDTFTNLVLTTKAVDMNTIGEFAISISGGTLTNADSYTVAYTNGKMTIVRIGVEDAIVSGITDINFNGNATVHSGLSVKVNGKMLTYGTHYEVTYKNNTAIGTATIIITGKGIYTGTIEKNFQVRVSKGASYTISNMKYKVTNAKVNGTGTVTLTGSTKSKSGLKGTLKIGDTVKIGGKSFKITAVGDKAFKGYTKLMMVTIGKNVTTIGKEAFYYCKKIKTITISSKQLKTVGKDAVKKIYGKAVMKVPSSKVKAYMKLFKSSTGFTNEMELKKK